MRLRCRVALAGDVTLAAFAGRRAAAAYPDRPIRLILPYPPRLPVPVVATLHAAFAEALPNPAVKVRLNDLDFTIDGRSAEACRAAIAARVESEPRVIREAGISLD
jgi:tripartite-type tricarboxylate transporter receptor subunit TctC